MLVNERIKKKKIAKCCHSSEPTVFMMKNFLIVDDKIYV